MQVRSYQVLLGKNHILNYLCFCGAFIIDQFVIKLLFTTLIATNCVDHPLKLLEEPPPYGVLLHCVFDAVPLLGNTLLHLPVKVND